MLRNLKSIVFAQLLSRRYAMSVSKDVVFTAFDKDELPPIDIDSVPFSRYGGQCVVTLITNSDRDLKAAGYIKSVFHHLKAPIMLEHIEVKKQKVPNEVLLSVMRAGSAIAIDSTHKIESKKMMTNMNTQLDLHTCVVNVFTVPGYNCRFPGLDIVVAMQNNRGDFSKMEYQPVKGLIETLKIRDKISSKKYIRFVFRYALKHGRKRITIGHKMSEFPLADGMVVKVAQKLQRQKYPDVQLELMDIDAMARKLIKDPSQFDVLCLDDKYGTFIGTIAGSVCGGVSLFSSIEFGDHHTVFKPFESKLSITGNDELAPYGVIGACVNLLKHLGYDRCASNLWRSLMKTMLDDEAKTCYFGGECSEQDVICQLIDNLKAGSCIDRK